MTTLPRGALLATLAATLTGLPRAAAQTPTPAAWPIEVAVGTHALTVPWHPGPITRGFDPAVMIGAQRPADGGEGWRLSLAMNVGFFRDRWWMTGGSLEPELRIGHRVAGRLEGRVAIGLGYMHYFWRRRTLKLHDGTYVPARDLGRPSLLLPLSLTLADRGRASGAPAVLPFVSVRWGVQALFLEEAPVMTHLTLLAGARIQRGGGGEGR